MASQPLIFSFLLLSILISSSSSFEPLIQLPTTTTTERKSHVDDNDDLYCGSWHLSVETNNAGSWKQTPSRCLSYVQDYMTSQRFISDSEIVANYSLAYAKSIEIAGDGKDAWIFDVDETLLTNLPYYQAHGFGLCDSNHNEKTNQRDTSGIDEDARLLLLQLGTEPAAAPAIPVSLKLYNELKQMGFKVFVLTGRSENQRNATGKNLLFAGYTGWEGLLLRYI
ncbi:hypothetical protein REPUB_Repub18cG0102100 [Reevesia pubescens]